MGEIANGNKETEGKREKNIKPKENKRDCKILT